MAIFFIFLGLKTMSGCPCMCASVLVYNLSSPGYCCSSCHWRSFGCCRCCIRCLCPDWDCPPSSSARENQTYRLYEQDGQSSSGTPVGPGNSLRYLQKDCWEHQRHYHHLRRGRFPHGIRPGWSWVGYRWIRIRTPRMGIQVITFKTPLKLHLFLHK